MTGSHADEKIEQANHLEEPGKAVVHRAVLRVLIYTQIAWIIVAGMVCRGVIIIPISILDSAPTIVGKSVEFVVVGALYYFPLFIVIWVCRSKLSTPRKLFVIVAEAGLTATHFLALLPAVQ